MRKILYTSVLLLGSLLSLPANADETTGLVSTWYLSKTSVDDRITAAAIVGGRFVYYGGKESLMLNHIPLAYYTGQAIRVIHTRGGVITDVTNP